MDAVRAAWLAVVVSGCACNQPQPVTTPQQVYSELVAVPGCLAPAEAGADAGAAELAKENARPDSPLWLRCLFDGGSVASCGVPCKH